MKITRLHFFLLLLTLAAPASAQNKSNLIETGTVKEVLKPDMVLLDSGKKYRLGGIRIPVDCESLALDELNHAALGKEIKVYGDGDTDRYGITLARLVRADGLQIQDDLVAKGLAWGLTPSLLSTEKKARARHAGFWSSPAHKLKTPDSVQDYPDSFQVVEGKILGVTEKDDYTYLNFGADWKTDFTVELPREYRHLFPDPAHWRNRKVRVRGWVEKRNGPMITLTHPEQIEFLK